MSSSAVIGALRFNKPYQNHFVVSGQSTNFERSLSPTDSNERLGGLQGMYSLYTSEDQASHNFYYCGNSWKQN